MQISSTRQSCQPKKKDTVDMLIEIGYSNDKAENLYNKYKRWGKLQQLQDYIDTKISLRSDYDSIPLRDM